MRPYAVIMRIPGIRKSSSNSDTYLAGDRAQGEKVSGKEGQKNIFMLGATSDNS